MCNRSISTVSRIRRVSWVGRRVWRRIFEGFVKRMFRYCERVHVSSRLRGRSDLTKKGFNMIEDSKIWIHIRARPKWKFKFIFYFCDCDFLWFSLTPTKKKGTFHDEKHKSWAFNFPQLFMTCEVDIECKWSDSKSSSHCWQTKGSSFNWVKFSGNPLMENFPLNWLETFVIFSLIEFATEAEGELLRHTMNNHR